MSKYAHIAIVTDCGDLDEMRYRVTAQRLFFPHAVRVSFCATESLNTLHAGFVGATHVVAEINRSGRLKEGEFIGLLVNAAPRLGREGGRPLRGENRQTAGEAICALLLQSGVWVVGPNAGLNFYFLQKEVRESFLVADPSGQRTPFRSNYVMMPALAQIFDPHQGSRIRLEPKALPPIEAEPGLFVGGQDSHGNLYIASTRPDERWVPPVGESRALFIGDHGPVRIRRFDGIFAGNTGDLALTTGSLELPDGRPVYYIVRVGGHAAPSLGHPRPGAKIRLERE